MKRNRKHRCGEAEVPNELQRILLPIPDAEPYQILHSVKDWMENNDRFKNINLEHDYPCLFLLLKNKPSDFVIRNSPEQGIYLKSGVLLAAREPSDSDVLRLLNYAVSMSAIPTEWEDCPVCREGYLEYWVQPHQTPRKVFLYCPECSYEEFLNGWDETAESSPIFPALRQDYKWIAPVVQKKKGYLPDWKKPYPEAKRRF